MLRVLAAGLLAALLVPAAQASGPSPIPSMHELQQGPGGGTVWQGTIPFRGLPGFRRPTVVYLPPDYSTTARYPVVFLLHGFRGSPYSFTGSVGLPAYADAAIAHAQLPPFVAVMPPAGPNSKYDGEWAGIWEDYLVQAVVPWARSHLSLLHTMGSTSVAGLSAGGFGAVDMTLRHPGLFGTAESWSGYFTAPNDGPLKGADPAEREAHDPSRLVEREARLLRLMHIRFFRSAGTDDREGVRDAKAFASELRGLDLPYRLVVTGGRHNGRFWRSQLPAALRYALVRS